MTHALTTGPPARERAGVLTFHRCVNHGSYWQARCLVEGLRARGLPAELLDHHAPRADWAELRCALEPTLPTPVPRADRARYRAKAERFRAAIAALPMSAPFELEDPGSAGAYGTVVVGSDEVWNLTHPWFGRYPAFFGLGVDADRLVSYAASCGSYEAHHGLDADRAAGLARFDALSVRDRNAQALVATAVGREAALVADPCLQFPPPVEGCWHGPEGPFVAVYGHNFSSGFAARVRRWADARGHRLVSVSYRNDWAHEQWLEAGPHDFLQAIARAGAVATNFFHGCVFALLHRRPLACEATGYRHTKVRGLVELLGGPRLVEDATPGDVLDALLDGPLDPAVDGALEGLRRSSGAFLDAALA